MNKILFSCTYNILMILHIKYKLLYFLCTETRINYISAMLKHKSIAYIKKNRPWHKSVRRSLFVLLLNFNQQAI